MDTKRLVTMMLLSFAVIFGWQLFVARLYKQHPEWKKPGQASTQPATTEPAVSTSTSWPTTIPTMGAATTTSAAATQGGPSMSATPAVRISATSKPVAITI